jgi:hypothetical protein
MEGSNLVADAMSFLVEIAPLLLLIGGISFADLTLNFLIKLVKQLKSPEGKLKW